jgi:hypothetical protein
MEVADGLSGPKNRAGAGGSGAGTVTLWGEDQEVFAKSKFMPAGSPHPCSLSLKAREKARSDAGLPFALREKGPGDEGLPTNFANTPSCRE